MTRHLMLLGPLCVGYFFAGCSRCGDPLARSSGHDMTVAAGSPRASVYRVVARPKPALSKPCSLGESLRRCGEGCREGQWCEYRYCWDGQLETALLLANFRGEYCDLGRPAGPFRSIGDCQNSELCRIEGLCALREDTCVADELAHCRRSLRCKKLGLCALHEGSCVSLGYMCREAGLCVQGPTGLLEGPPGPPP